MALQPEDTSPRLPIADRTRRARRRRVSRKQVRVLAWIHIVLAGLVLLVVVGLTALVIVTNLGWGQSEASTDSAGSLHFRTSFGLPELVVVATLAGFYVLELIAGIGLLQLRRWARWTCVSIAALGILNFPLGTALGVYTLLVLLNPAVAPMFGKPAPYPEGPVGT